MNKQDFIDLYMLCFPEDSYNDAEGLWNMTPEDRIMVLYDGSIPCSMLVLLDGNLVIGKNVYPLYYIYAACTHPGYRKQGKMGQLLKLSYKKAIADKKYGLFLRPASEKLAGYYANEGFKPFSGIKTEVHSYSSSGPALIKLSVQEGMKYRKTLIEKNFRGYISWSPQIVTNALSYVQESGGGAYTDSLENPSVFILAEPGDKKVFIREAIGTNAKSYIPKLVHSLGYQSALIRRPGTVQDQCFGMIMTENIPSSEDIYMGIALD